MERILPLRSEQHPFNEIINKVEEKTGQLFNDKEIEEVYAHTLRKCKINGKDSDYIPILFENELRDYLMIAFTNIRGKQNIRARAESKGDLNYV